MAILAAPLNSPQLSYGKRIFDVVVVGAGPAGAATAYCLAQAGCRVALIEGSRFDSLRAGESLAPDVQPLLLGLGLWPNFQALNPLPSYGTRAYWGSDECQTQSYFFSPYACGWHVDRQDFDQMLTHCAAAAGAELIFGTVCSAEPNAQRDAWDIAIEKLADGSLPATAIRAQVLVDASGRNARIARKLGGRRAMFDHLLGVAGLFGGIDMQQESYILVETVSEGWWYSAPLPSGHMVAMLMTDGDLCRRYRLTTPAHWHRQLQAAPATSSRLAVGDWHWGPGVFSAISQRLRRNDFVSPWFAVGDAALSVDPISGSGVVRALRSAGDAANLAMSLLGQGTHAGLEAYEAQKDEECTQYLYERASYYGVERRWPESPFWQRRAIAANKVRRTREKV